MFKVENDIRKGLVRDLHDDLAGQLLSVIKILLGGHDHIPHLRTERVRDRNVTTPST
jgi:hypothetical protein